MRRRGIFWAAYALLLVFWGLLVLGAWALSLSMDEPLHIVAGYIYLARGVDGLWFMPLRLPPPLLNALNALGIYGYQPHIPLETLAGWGENFVLYTDSFMPYLLPLERTEVLARTPMMLLTVLLGALVFRWGRELGGYRAGILALGLLTFDPLILAHGRLAHTDAGVTFFGTMALYAGGRWIQQPSWKWNLTAGLFLGLTLLSKFSAILWLIAWGLLVSYGIIRQRHQGLRSHIVQGLIAIGLAFLLVWAFFGFSVGYTSRLPFPVPAPMYWEGAFAQQATADERIFIAFGVQRQGVHWWYFPLNFLIKNPLPLLILLPIGGWGFIRARWKHSSRLGLLIFPLLYTLVAIIAGPNISYRHMLPVHPFLHLILATGLTHAVTPRIPRIGSLILPAVGSLLAFWYIGGTLRLFPDELTYFNELVGGPERGFRYLVDYTQDWGQAFKELRIYLEAHPGPEPQIFYFTHTHPDHYGIVSQRMDRPTPFHPQPGRYVLGPAPLYGLTGPGAQAFDWFRHACPTAMVGHSLFVYDVMEKPAWIAQCTVPVPPLDDTAIRQGFGSTDIRRVDFDCTQAWVYPNGGQPMGVYTLHHDLLPARERCLFATLPDCAPLATDAFLRQHLAGLRLSYEQRSPGTLPAFVAYELSDENGLPALPSPYLSLAVPAGTSPLEASTPLTAPIPLQGPSVFLGVRSYIIDDYLDVETWWQVTEGSVTRPLSIMGHLLNGSGELIGQADGLGVSPVVWQTGDIIVQRHRFPRPPAGTELWLRTGVYWLDTMERWPLTGITNIDMLLLPLRIEP